MDKDEKYFLIRNLVEAANSQIFSVEFVKKDGEKRKMAVQQATAKFKVKGEEASESTQRAVQTRKENHPELLNVWDVGKKAFRSINMNTVYKLVMEHKTYTFDILDDN